MRSYRALLVLLLLFALCSTVTAQSIDEPRFVNKLLGNFHTPVIVPGESGIFSLSIVNPDPINLTGDMTNVMLNISIYQYATLEETETVPNISDPPIIVESGAPEHRLEGLTIPPGTQHDVTFTVTTERSTPHGSYFSQSTYFVRFWLEFEYEGENYTMVSRGYFSDAQWEHLTGTESGAGEINQTYMEELGYDGIIPDSSFAVKIPIPMWPFWALVALTIFVAFLAVAFYILDNPGISPRLEIPLLRLSGRLQRLRWKLSRRRKPPT